MSTSVSVCGVEGVGSGVCVWGVCSMWGCMLYVW